MRLHENRVKNNDLHENLTTSDPWGDVEEGRFIGRLVLDEWFAEDEYNVAVYNFDVQSLIDDFIDGYTIPVLGHLDEKGAEKAKVIIADMENMISTLKAFLPT